MRDTGSAFRPLVIPDEAYGIVWCVVNQTGTQAILASEGVSSITDGGTGITTVTFTTAFVDATYGIAGMSISGAFIHSQAAASTSSFQYRNLNDAGAAADAAYTAIVISGRAHIKADTSHVCKVWVTVDSSSTSPVILDSSGGVSSITDNGAGDFTFNWTTAFSSANYAVVANDKATKAAHAGYDSTTAVTAAQMRIDFGDVDTTSADTAYMSVAAWGAQS